MFDELILTGDWREVISRFQPKESVEGLDGGRLNIWLQFKNNTYKKK